MSLTQYRPLSFFIFACLYIYSTLQMVDSVCFAFFLGVILFFCLEKAQFCSLKGLTLAHSSILTSEEDGQSWRSRPWIWRNGIGAMRVVRRRVKLRENQKERKDFVRTGAGQDKVRERVFVSSGWTNYLFFVFFLL